MNTYDTVTRNLLVFCVVATFLYSLQLIFIPIFVITMGGILAAPVGVELNSLSMGLNYMGGFFIAWTVFGIYALKHPSKIMLHTYLGFSLSYTMSLILIVLYQKMIVGIYGPITEPSTLYIITNMIVFSLLFIYMWHRNK